MGLGATFLIVTDWPYIASERSTDETMEMIYDATEYFSYLSAPQELLRPQWCYEYEADLLSNWKYAYRDACNYYEKFVRPALSDSERVDTDAILQALFWHGTECDLTQQSDLAMALVYSGCNHDVLVSINPINTRRLSASLDSLLHQFATWNLQGSLDDANLCTFQEWLSYVKRWQALLGEASAKDAGLIVEAC